MRNTISLLIAVALISLVPFATANAGTGIFGSYIGIDSGSGNEWYGANQPGSSTVSGFDGSDLGDFTVGDSLLLSGAELLTWKSDGGNVTGASVYYAIYSLGASAGSFDGAGINWTTNSPFNDAAGNNFSSGGDQKWANIDSTPNLLAGIPAGDYNVAMYFTASTSEGTQYDSNGGNNYVATISVASASSVPEPTACMLLIAGIIPLVLLRRRK